MVNVRPTNCHLCMRAFAERPVLQLEAAHVAAFEGEGAARMLIDEKLEETHAEHGKNSTH